MAFDAAPLPYDYDALQPSIDEETMRIHHDKHYQGYTDKLNAALNGTKWADQPIEETLANLDALPEDKQTAVRNNGGGFLNHGIFWTIMSPDGGGQPTGELASAIEQSFGSFDAFKEKFEAAATGQFGSGWAWLELKSDGGLRVHGHANQDNPVMHGAKPIIGLDVWEHAYYLKYQNKRPAYVSAWWDVVNWDEADRRYRSYKAQ
ncbi:superoxide dismutase [Rubrivirga sp. S365]|uniref:Superoxide dismutase n=1 Tax=Rubrivirga litoralis TaxID=3075598 RepID=A0ABU3BNL8_9BACT|nr:MULTISPECIES: superoxide dismutase [unclassified Rubrivirga]MDT0630868.1 superoxide dismutase [Rubrivirga sp. F394]MDT7857420.1 superoxide dismutase [Rubrivirga sp. S365]